MEPQWKQVWYYKVKVSPPQKKAYIPIFQVPVQDGVHISKNLYIKEENMDSSPMQKFQVSLNKNEYVNENVAAPSTVRHFPTEKTLTSKEKGVT